MMHLNLFSQCSPSPQLKGFWRDPADRSATGYRQLAYWQEIAGKLEDACFDALFFADIHGTYDTYGGDHRAAVEHGVQIPSIDPTLVVAALAATTKKLGFAVTYSTTYHAPYECARLFSSLDHLTDGRIAWNIVTSYLSSASRNGLGDFLDHDVRYDRADEYVTVARKLWEESWEDDAVVRDVEALRFADPDRVHTVDHHGEHFSVQGPHQCEPSPQRTPVLYQAGASSRGTTFAAQHAEVVFLTMADPEKGAPQVAALRQRAAELGRDPASLKALQGSMVIIGENDADAQAKAQRYLDLWDGPGQLVKWCGWMGVDLGAHADDTPMSELPANGSTSFMRFLEGLGGTKDWTVGEIKQIVTRARKPRRNHPVMLFGTPETVADRMEEWIERADVDGFNLIPCTPTQGVDDICNLLVPELQRRGIFRRSYDDTTTLRDRYFGAGATPPARTPALAV